MAWRKLRSSAPSRRLTAGTCHCGGVCPPTERFSGHDICCWRMASCSNLLPMRSPSSGAARHHGGPPTWSAGTCRADAPLRFLHVQRAISGNPWRTRLWESRPAAIDASAAAGSSQEAGIGVVWPEHLVKRRAFAEFAGRDRNGGEAAERWLRHDLSGSHQPGTAMWRPKGSSAATRLRRFPFARSSDPSGMARRRVSAA